uniref:Aryl hydrocarbon receptor nuclear translocator-like protein 1 n=1 Tax=Cacopsylla melanoneura TaxID=428564 RepID=A0A8D8XP17_9HEMI
MPLTNGNGMDPSLSPRGEGPGVEEDDDESSDPGSCPSLSTPTSTTCTTVSNVQNLPSSTRLARNYAEKQRRTKLNTYIDELRSLVPMVQSSVAARSGKKVDKTSILRLSATFMRMDQILYGNRSQFPSLPSELKDFNWSQFILDDMDGILLLVTSAGKIVFISHTIDKILGHNQTELFGQSLYSFTCPEDHDELRKNLSPDYDPASMNPTPAVTAGSTPQNSHGYCEMSADEAEDSSCGASSNASSPRSSSGAGATSPHPKLQTTTERQRRSFYLRLRQKGCSRSEKPQYELVHVLGHLRITRRSTQDTGSEGGLVTRRSRKPRELNMGCNDVVLAAVVRPFKERRVTSLSLLESTREEYITRHLKDGRIIYCDHRISFVSGYMSTEISGLSGFAFMHKDDMKWVMIALRQMYIKNEAYGSSCYRLVDKTGEFFYIRTHGYLEFDPSDRYADDYFPSFICINTLMSREEGETAIRNMKTRFTPLIEIKGEPGTLAIAESLTDPTNQRSLSTDSDSTHAGNVAETLSDPDELKICIKSLISNIPTPTGPKPHSPASRLGVGEELQCKLKQVSKAMPPASVHTDQIKCSLSVEESIKRSPHHATHTREENLNPPTSSVSLPPVQNRPSVLRGPIRGSERGDGQHHGSTKRARDEDMFVDNEICDKKARSCFESPGVLVSPQSSSSVSSYCQSPVEAVSTTEDSTLNSANNTYLNLDAMQDGMDVRKYIIEAPSFIVDVESEVEAQHTVVHSSDLFRPHSLWDERKVNDDLLSDKTSCRLSELSSLNSSRSHNHHPLTLTSPVTPTLPLPHLKGPTPTSPTSQSLLHHQLTDHRSLQHQHHLFPR